MRHLEGIQKHERCQKRGKPLKSHPDFSKIPYWEFAFQLILLQKFQNFRLIRLLNRNFSLSVNRNATRLLPAAGRHNNVDYIVFLKKNNSVAKQFWQFLMQLSYIFQRLMNCPRPTVSMEVVFCLYKKYEILSILRERSIVTINTKSSTN